MGTIDRYPLLAREWSGFFGLLGVIHLFFTLSAKMALETSEMSLRVMRFNRTAHHTVESGLTGCMVVDMSGLSMSGLHKKWLFINVCMCTTHYSFAIAFFSDGVIIEPIFRLVFLLHDENNAS